MGNDANKVEIEPIEDVMKRIEDAARDTGVWWVEKN